MITELSANGIIERYLNDSTKPHWVDLHSLIICNNPLEYSDLN